MLIGAIIASFLNIVLLIIKFKRKRWPDAGLDLGLLVIVFMVLKGSEDMLLIGIYTSLGISIYLWFSPPMPIRHAR